MTTALTALQAACIALARSYENGQTRAAYFYEAPAEDATIGAAALAYGREELQKAQAAEVEASRTPAGGCEFYDVLVGRTETYAHIRIEAFSRVEAKRAALTTDKLNAAEWHISDGNFIRVDDCAVIDVTEA